MNDSSSVFGYQISIHAPRGGSDLIFISRFLPIWAFQSTLPVGGATSRHGQDAHNISDFNPRSPWGERHRHLPHISEHILFQSTLPVGGATQTQEDANHHRSISIHAPRGGSDHIANDQGQPPRDFNPRSPWGERRFSSGGGTARRSFQSTLPVGGATISAR